MNAGGKLFLNPLVRLGLVASLILLITQAGWLESLIFFLLTGMVGTFSIPPLLMLFAYIIAGAFVTRALIFRSQNQLSRARD